MQKATIAKLSLTALVGLGSLTGTADVAQAGPGPQQGSIKVAPPTTTTTIQPLDAEPVGYCDLHLCLEAEEVEPEADLPIVQPEPEYCDVHLCIPADEVDPCPPSKCDKAPVPQDDPDPGCPANVLCDELTQPEPECNTTHGCDEGGTGGGTGGSDGETTDGGDEGGTDGVTSDGGETDGGSTGGGGPLPKTGGDIATVLGVGLGLTGVGAAARKLGRRER